MWGWGGRAHHKNQLNVLPFPPTETDIFNIIAHSLRGCISSLSKHSSQEVQCVEQWLTQFEES